MKRALPLAVLAVFAACSPKTETGKEKGMAIYEGLDKRFTCEAPADWRVQEDGDMVSFYGPPEGTEPYAARVSVRFFSKSSQTPTPQAYALAQKAAGAKITPLLETSWKGGTAYAFTAERTLRARHGRVREQERRESAVLIPAADGFYAVIHSAAPEAQAATAAVFQKVLDTLNPR